MLEHERRGRVSNGAVARRVLVLQLRGRARGSAGLRSIALVGLLHRRRVDGRDRRVDVDPCDARKRGCDCLVLVEEQCRREEGELQGPEGSPLAPRCLQAHRHDRPARATGTDDPRPRIRRQRHAEPAKPPCVPLRRAQRRVAPVDVLLRHVRQPDQHEPPLELRSVAPLEHAERGIRGVPPRAPRVVEQRHLHRLGHCVQPSCRRLTLRPRSPRSRSRAAAVQGRSPRRWCPPGTEA